MPTKVCRKCSVMSETEAEKCPNCGASYGRRGLSRVETAAIGVTVLAIGATIAFGMNTGDDDGPAPEAKVTPTPTPAHTIRFEQAAVLDAETPLETVLADFGPPRPDLQGNQKRMLGRNRCIYYDIRGARTDAQLCFFKGKLKVVAVNYPSDMGTEQVDPED